MKKLLPLALSLALSSVSLADTVFVGSKGKGAARTVDGRVGGFDYNVSKRTFADGSFRTEGKLRFEQRANAFGRWVLIEMGKPADMGSNGVVAEFAGPGTIVVLVNGKRVPFKGTVSVRTADLRTPNSPTTLDTFRIRFRGPNDVAFEFDGTVREGDLVVVRTVQH